MSYDFLMILRMHIYLRGFHYEITSRCSLNLVIATNNFEFDNRAGGGGGGQQWELNWHPHCEPVYGWICGRNCRNVPLTTFHLEKKMR